MKAQSLLQYFILFIIIYIKYDEMFGGRVLQHFNEVVLDSLEDLLLISFNHEYLRSLSTLEHEC